MTKDLVDQTVVTASMSWMPSWAFWSKGVCLVLSWLSFSYLGCSCISKVLMTFGCLSMTDIGSAIVASGASVRPFRIDRITKDIVCLQNTLNRMLMAHSQDIAGNYALYIPQSLGVTCIEAPPRIACRKEALNMLFSGRITADEQVCVRYTLSSSPLWLSRLIVSLSCIVGKWPRHCSRERATLLTHSDWHDPYL